MSVKGEKVDLRSESADEICLGETETCKADVEGRGGRKMVGRKKRILYDREFLIKCFHNPSSFRKPNGFPIPHLDCTLGLSKVKRLPFSAPQPHPLLTKGKNDGTKRDRETEDHISLRPQSGNFSSGPNLSSPLHNSSSTNFSRLHDDSKGYDRDYHRNNFRRDFGNHRRELNDRNRIDRDRDMDHRDRMGTGRDRLNNHRSSNSWSNDGQDNDWSRRRNGAHFPKDREYGGHHRRYDHRREDEQEPEWFSGGPSSQHETIELRGFMDDDRKDRGKDVRNGGSEKSSSDHNGDVDSSGESTKNENACESPMDLSLEKILKLDHLPGFFVNDMEEEEPSGSSRFSQLFKRNSATPVPTGNLMQSNNEDKKVQEMGELLRTMLIKKPAQEEPQQISEPKVNEAANAKPAPASKDDKDAFKKLVTPLFAKVLQGPVAAPPTKSQSTSNDEGGSVLDIFKHPSVQAKPQQQSPPHGPVRSNSLQDIFNNMMNKPNNAPMQPPKGVHVVSPGQILQRIPPEMQHLVMSYPVNQWDFVQLANIAKTNEWTFQFVLDQFVMQQCPPQQRMIFAGLLNLAITGRLTFPDVIVHDQQRMNHGIPPPMPQPMTNHQAPPPQCFEKFIPRQDSQDSVKEMTKRSGTPVSNMFTPTSVMRKMTADGNKGMPLANSQEFVPIPASGGLLPTPPTTSSVMNSNNPNLANLMSSMNRPPQMHYRPHPQMMGFPPQPNFHPGMMPPPNMHGPVMMPPPFQTILPNQQQIYNNKLEEN